jgi:GNAT superfamily N-acetyltransferase
VGAGIALTAPEPLHEGHRRAEFHCGRSALDAWLGKRALRNQQSGASRTFVVCSDERVIAYYALASGAVTAEQASGRLRRNMPDPIPMVLLARLAVDQGWQGRGLGRALLRDAGLRVIGASESIGIRGLLTQAIDASAKAFYQRIGFDPSSLDPMTLMITLTDLRASLVDARR